MHPTLLPRPFHHVGWVYEEKVDGYRMVVYKDDDGVRLISRNGRDHTRRFPELVKALGPRRLAGGSSSSSTGWAWRRPRQRVAGGIGGADSAGHVLHREMEKV